MQEEKYILLSNDIKNGKFTLEELKEYFNDTRNYIPKADFTKLLIELIGSVDFKFIAEIIKSNKGRLYNNLIDDCGEPLLNVIILQTTLSIDFDKYKNDLFDFLEEENNNIIWDMHNNFYENAFHIICYLSNYYEKSDIIRFINILKKHNLNPLMLNSDNHNSIDVFKRRCLLPKKDKLEIISLLESIVNDSIIEVNNYVEEVEEVESIAQ